VKDGTRRTSDDNVLEQVSIGAVAKSSTSSSNGEKGFALCESDNPVEDGEVV
jgi:hypothetical protein